MSAASLESCKDLLATLGYSVTPPGEGSPRRSLCEGLHGLYSVGGHVGSLFLILFASVLGVVLPLLTKYVEVLRSNPYAFTIGKTAATGVLLSVSTIHLINEAIVALDEPCVPSWLTQYEAYAFLFALVAVLLMQALDLELADVAEQWMRKRKQTPAEELTIVSSPSDSPAEKPPAAVAPRERAGESVRVSDACTDEAPVAVSPTCDENLLGLPERPFQPRECDPHPHSHGHHGGGVEEEECHGHQHLFVLPPEELGSVRQVIAAICMEFGVALHSIFVGVAVGLTTDQELKPLLVALFFHQAFEGMAMGSRIVDASFHGKLEIALALIFACSAPAGMGVAIAVVSVSRDAMSGGKFVATMGILDAFCGGILLYLAFNLLFLDFPADMRRYSCHGQPNARRRKVGLFAALWFGMLLMAAVGNWL